MPTLREIKRRITSVRSTQQITSAMKMVSAAKLNRAQTAVRAAQPYAEKLRQMVSSLHGTVGGEDHPLFIEREGGPSRVILFTSDRGLCGNFNNNLSRTVFAILTAASRASERARARSCVRRPTTRQLDPEPGALRRVRHRPGPTCVR